MAIFGAGVAGLTVAHELVERGFDVTVFERNSIAGGKCRTWPLPGTGSGGRADLPAEHGFRFFPGFYENISDSMQRTPRPEHGDTVYASLRNLRELDGFGGAISTGPEETVSFELPTKGVAANPELLGDPVYLANSVARAATMLTGAVPLMPAELADFVGRVLVYVTSSWQRRHTEWDRISWWDFLRGDDKSELFQNLIVKSLTSVLQASKSRAAAASSTGNIVDGFLWNALGLGRDSRTAYLGRLLDGPTSEVWIEPWVRHLRRLGVRFHTGEALESLHVRAGVVRNARVVDGSGRRARVDADWFVPAMQVDKATRILTTPEVLAAEPRFELLTELGAAWMNGLQIYVRRHPESAKTFGILADHPWSLSQVSLDSQWRGEARQRYGDGGVADVVSCAIAEWGEGAGTTVVGKPAKECGKDEIFREVWETFKQRLGPIEPLFRDDGNVATWTVDPAIRWSNGAVTNDDLLTTNEINTWQHRPAGPTAIRNLFLAGDWTQTNGNVGAMEVAAQSARTAAQGILDASGNRAVDVANWNYYTPEELEPLKRLDAERVRRGERNVFDLLPGQSGPAGDPGRIVEDAVRKVLRER